MSFLFGSQKSTSSIPSWMKEPIQQNVRAAQNVAALGYVPYYGPDVAAMTPMQEAAFRNTGQAMSAFGMEAPADPMAGMPQAETFAGGVRGYSSAPMYEAALETLKQKNPAQYAAIMSIFDQFKAAAKPPAQAVNPYAGMTGKGGGLTEAERNARNSFHGIGTSGGGISIGKGGVTVGKSGSLFGGNSWSK